MNYHTDALADRLSKLVRDGYPFSYVGLFFVFPQSNHRSTDEHSWSLDRL
jgi:hypothetical protein